MSNSLEMGKTNSYPWFDWLRFFLASIVMLGHAHFQFLPFLDGAVAVAVFFALSGWLIGGILLRIDLSELPRFFFDRVTRIWIPYGIAIMLLYGLAVAKGGLDFYWFKYLLLDLTFTHQPYVIFPAASYEMPLAGSGNQFWTISIEEQFYLVAPIIMFLTPLGKSLKSWFVIALSMLLLNSNYAPIAMGVCAAVFQRDYDIVSKASVRTAAFAIAFGCAAALSVLGIKFILQPVFALAVVVALAIPGSRSKIAIVAGGLSYPLYLNHWIGIFAMHYVSKHFLPIGEAVFIASQFVLNVLLALLMYWIIDREIHKRRNSWFTPRSGRTLTYLAYGLVGVGIFAGGAMQLFGPHAVGPKTLVKIKSPGQPLSPILENHPAVSFHSLRS